MGEFLWDLAHAIATFVRWILAFQTSAFVVTTIAALVAAYLGSYGASRYAEWKKERDELLAEIRNTNAAIMTAFITCNLALNLKDELVAPLKRSFDRAKAEYLEHMKRRGKHPGGPALNIQTDLKDMPVLFWPIDLLRASLFGKVSLTGRPLAVVATLSQTYHSLNHAIERRNEIIADLNSKSPVPPSTLIPLYFGVPNSHGQIDERFSDLIAATYSHTDSCIYFCELLCKDLYEHVLALRRTFRSRFFRDAPTAHRPQFSEARRKGLMPDPKDFEAWEKSFIKEADAEKQATR